MKTDYSLYLVTDRTLVKNKFLLVIEEALKGGVSVVQLREKHANSYEFYKMALEIKELTDNYNVPLIINDRLDIALLVNAAGVHLGQMDLPVNKVRQLIGKTKIIGASVATLKEAKEAEKHGADYLGVGAIYSTNTKKNTTPVTLYELFNIKSNVNIPVIAIGGININNITQVINSGVDGIAVSSSIMLTESPQKASKELFNIINYSKGS